MVVPWRPAARVLVLAAAIIGLVFGIELERGASNHYLGWLAIAASGCATIAAIILLFADSADDRRAQEEK